MVLLTLVICWPPLGGHCLHLCLLGFESWVGRSLQLKLKHQILTLAMYLFQSLFARLSHLNLPLQSVMQGILRLDILELQLSFFPGNLLALDVCNLFLVHVLVARSGEGFQTFQVILVDVGFVNQNSGFINQRFDNQGSTTKVRQLKTAVSSTKVRQPKSWIRQPRGSSTKKIGFVNQKRRIHQPRFVNQGSSTKVRQPKTWIRQPRIRQPKGWIRQPKTADSSTKVRQPKTRIRQPRIRQPKGWIRPKTADSKVPEHF